MGNSDANFRHGRKTAEAIQFSVIFLDPALAS
jgi:hypothetical protein